MGDQSAKVKKLNKKQIVQQRLQQQGLSQPEFKRPDEVVGWLGAVQAQDYAAAKWGVALRAQGLTDADLDLAVPADRDVEVVLLGFNGNH